MGQRLTPCETLASYATQGDAVARYTLRKQVTQGVASYARHACVTAPPPKRGSGCGDALRRGKRR
jgi:hypothetical protein